MNAPQLIAIDCPGCGQDYHVPPPSQDQRAKCKRCGREFVIATTVVGRRQKYRPPAGHRAADDRYAGAVLAHVSSKMRRPREWPRLSRRAMVAASMVLLAGVTAVVFFAAFPRERDEQPVARKPPRGRVAKLSVPRSDYEFDTVTELIEAIEPAVVHIETDSGISSGFVLDSSGLIVTCRHCIATALTGRVVFADKTSKEILGVRAMQADRDLAIIEVDVDRPLPMLSLASARPKKGEPIVAFGSPAGLSFTVSEGSVSAVRTGEEVVRLSRRPEWGLRGDTRFHLSPDVDLIQFTASTMPGNSGGPVVDFRGNVIGISAFGLDWRGHNYEFCIAWSEIESLASKMSEKLIPLHELFQLTEEVSAAVDDRDNTLRPKVKGEMP